MPSLMLVAIFAISLGILREAACQQQVEVFVKRNTQVKLLCPLPKVNVTSNLMVVWTRLGNKNATLVAAEYIALYGKKLANTTKQGIELRFLNRGRSEQEQRYLCIVVNEHGESVQFSEFKVFTVLECTSPIINYTEALEIGKKTISCTSVSYFGVFGKVVPVITWEVSSLPAVSVNSSSIVHGNTITSSITLNITRSLNKKEVKCSLFNPPNNPVTLQTSIILDILYPPAVTAQPAFLVTAEGSEFSMECLVDANPGPSDVKWLFLGALIGQTPNVLVRAATMDHAGEYVCLVTNSLGSANSSVAVTILPMIASKGSNYKNSTHAAMVKNWASKQKRPIRFANPKQDSTASTDQGFRLFPKSKERKYLPVLIAISGSVFLLILVVGIFECYNLRFDDSAENTDTAQESTSDPTSNAV